MSVDLTQLWGLGSVALIIPIVSLIKPFLRDQRLYPVAALVLGVSINVLLALVLGKSLETGIVLGLVSGLSASGLWDTGSTWLKR